MNYKMKNFYSSKNKYDVAGRKLTIQIYDAENYIITGHYNLFDESLKRLLKIKKNFHEIIISEIPDFTFKALEPINFQINFKFEQSNYSIQYNPSDRQKKVQDLPKQLYDKLYHFQEQGIEFAIKNCGRVLIADEMGVGKTIQAVSLGYLYKSAWPMLIIAPSSLVLNWRDEIKKWLNKEVKNSEIQLIQKSQVEIRPTSNIIIISYDLCTKLQTELEAKNFGVAIADEAHYLKNSQAKRTECITPLLQKTKHVILLTGTPALAKPKELFSLLHILRPDIFKFFREFGNRYCDPKPSKWSKGIDYEGSSNSRELYYLLNANLMIRRLKRDVLSELPSKRRQKVEINVDPKISAEIQKLLNKTAGLDKYLDEIMEMNQRPSMHGENDENQDESMPVTKQMINETLTRCYLLTGLAKLKGINHYIADITENECKFLIFGHHMEVLDGIESELVKLKLKYIRIDGSTPMVKRHDLVQQFQENTTIRIALLGISATGIGLTLTAASTILFAEMHWTPAIMLQAEDRAHRIGQVNSVNCHYLYGGGTLDDKLYQKLDHKLGIVSEMIDGLRKDLEVENNLKKGDFGAVSIDKTLGAKPVKKMFQNEREEREDSGQKDKITSFFEVVGVKSSTINSEEKKQIEPQKQISPENCFNTISSIPKENNNSTGSDIPDLELLDKLVEEINQSKKKEKEQQIKEKEEFEKKKQINEKEEPAKKKKALSIEQMRQVFNKEFKNNLIQGAEFIIDSNENSVVKSNDENLVPDVEEIKTISVNKPPKKNKEERNSNNVNPEIGIKKKRSSIETLKDSDPQLNQKFVRYKE